MAQSTWTAIATRIKERVATVAGVGMVHDHLELATTLEELKAIGTATIDGEARIRLWMIHLEQMPSVWSEQGATADWRRTALIEGFLQFEASGAAEKTAIALSESIIRVLNADLATTKLNGTVLSGGPCALLASEPRAFGPVLVHYCRLALPLFTIESP
jgi:hypothetical protein